MSYGEQVERMLLLLEALQHPCMATMRREGSDKPAVAGLDGVLAAFEDCADVAFIAGI